jgi:hypothetical protein
MGSKAAPINELVNFLHKQAPARLQQLREALPTELRHELEAGGVLGAERAPLLLARCDVALESLSEMIPIGQNAIQKSASRLKSARACRFVGEIVSLISSAGVLTCLGLNNSKMAILTGTLALISSFAVLLAEHAIRLPVGGNESLYTLYTKLIDILYNARIVERELRVLKDLGDEQTEGPRLEQLVQDANRICGEINAIRSPLLGPN